MISACNMECLGEQTIIAPFLIPCTLVYNISAFSVSASSVTAHGNNRRSKLIYHVYNTIKASSIPSLPVFKFDQ